MGNTLVNSLLLFDETDDDLKNYACQPANATSYPGFLGRGPFFWLLYRCIYCTIDVIVTSCKITMQGVH